MPPPWLHALSIAWLVLSGVTVIAIAADLPSRKQPMAVMNAVWPITALYFGPLALWIYATMGRTPGAGVQDGGHRHGGREKPFWQSVFVGTTHCGAGCTLGDIVAETVVFAAGIAIAGSAFGAELAGDFLLAYLLGVAFQYFSIAPMRHLPPGPGLWAAIKADTLSLIAFEAGLFAWMALMRFVFFHPPLRPDQVEYWFMMQAGMVIGFATSYPMNWWLLRAGVKEAM